MEFGVEAFECVRILPRLRLIRVIELDHYDMLGNGPFPRYRFIHVDRQAARERRFCGHQILDRDFESLRIGDLRYCDLDIGTDVS